MADQDGSPPRCYKEEFDNWLQIVSDIYAAKKFNFKSLSEENASHRQDYEQLQIQLTENKKNNEELQQERQQGYTPKAADVVEEEKAQNEIEELKQQLRELKLKQRDTAVVAHVPVAIVAVARAATMRTKQSGGDSKNLYKGQTIADGVSGFTMRVFAFAENIQLYLYKADLLAHPGMHVYTTADGEKQVELFKLDDKAEKILGGEAHLWIQAEFVKNEDDEESVLTVTKMQVPDEIPQAKDAKTNYSRKQILANKELNMVINDIKSEWKDLEVCILKYMNEVLSSTFHRRTLHDIKELWIATGKTLPKTVL